MPSYALLVRRTLALRRPRLAKSVRVGQRNPRVAERLLENAPMPSKKLPAAKFSPEERAAMKERQRELKAQAAGADGEAEVQAKIAEMPQPDRAMAERIHAIVREV